MPIEIDEALLPKIRKCPFCGEEPQVSSKNNHLVMHACRVLGVEIRITDEQWNGWKVKDKK